MIERDIKLDLEQFRGDLDVVNEILSREGLSIDIDNTEFDTASASTVEYNWRHPKYKKRIEDMDTYWAMVDWCKKIPYIKDGEKEADDIWHCERVMLGADLVEGAGQLAAYLDSRILRLYRITSRPVTMRNFTIESYRRRLPFVDPDKIHQTDKNEIDPWFKVDRNKVLRLKYSFEDSQQHAELLAAIGMTIVLVPQPWNKNYIPANGNILTVTKYEDSPKLIRVYLTLAEHIASHFRVAQSY